MNQPGYMQSDSEEENSQTNEKYYQNFLDRLYNDGNRGNSKNKYQENKMYLHVNINNIISNSNNDNSKKFLEQNQNQIKLFNPSELFPQDNIVRGKRNSVTFKNLNPFINQTPKLFNVNRKKRNSCMIPLPLLEQLTGAKKSKEERVVIIYVLEQIKKRVKRRKEFEKEGKTKQSCFLCCLPVKKE